MEGMYWGDFARLIDNNKRPWRTIKYYRSPDGFKNTISICDFTLPRRKGLGHKNNEPLSTAYGHSADWYRESFVCNTGYLDGWIPLVDGPVVWNEVTHTWEVYPVRGMRETLKELVSSETIYRSDEVRRICGELL